MAVEVVQELHKEPLANRRRQRVQRLLSPPAVPAIQPSAPFRNGILRVLRLTDKEQIRLRLDDDTQPFAKPRRHRPTISVQVSVVAHRPSNQSRLYLNRTTVNDSTAH